MNTTQQDRAFTTSPRRPIFAGRLAARFYSFSDIAYASTKIPMKEPGGWRGANSVVSYGEELAPLMLCKGWATVLRGVSLLQSGERLHLKQENRGAKPGAHRADTECVKGKSYD